MLSPNEIRKLDGNDLERVIGERIGKANYERSEAILLAQQIERRKDLSLEAKERLLELVRSQTESDTALIVVDNTLARIRKLIVIDMDKILQKDPTTKELPLDRGGVPVSVAEEDANGKTIQPVFEDVERGATGLRRPLVGGLTVGAALLLSVILFLAMR